MDYLLIISCILGAVSGFTVAYLRYKVAIGVYKRAKILEEAERLDKRMRVIEKGGERWI